MKLRTFQSQDIMRTKTVLQEISLGDMGTFQLQSCLFMLWRSLRNALDTLSYSTLLCVLSQIQCNNFVFVVLRLSSFSLHVSAVTDHHQVYFHLRSCHTARNPKFRTTSSLNVVAAFQSVSCIRISLSVMFYIPVNIHSSIWFKILRFNYNLI
jgi:hypothetical protein